MQDNLIYEDELPEDITDEEYDEWFADSAVIDGVRMGPKMNMDVTDDDCINWCPECGEPREVCEAYKTCSIWEQNNATNDQS